MKQTLLTIVFAVSLSLMILTVAIYIPAIADWVMLPLMEHFAPPEETGLPANEYKPVVKMITGYLRGEEINFQHIFSVDGTEYAAFNQKEQQHMADVRDLFELPPLIFYVCAGVLLLSAWGLRHDMSMRTFRRTLIAILAAVTAFIVLACIDFSSLFVLFHKVAFTNDLWLLDPQTDLLIRLMPIEFFISYAAIIGGIWLLGMAGLLVIATHRIKKTTERE